MVKDAKSGKGGAVRPPVINLKAEEVKAEESATGGKDAGPEKMAKTSKTGPTGARNAKAAPGKAVGQQCLSAKAHVGQVVDHVGDSVGFQDDRVHPRLDVLGLPAAQVLMVGDRLETDILGGQKAGLLTALVSAEPCMIPLTLVLNRVT